MSASFCENKKIICTFLLEALHRSNKRLSASISTSPHPLISDVEEIVWHTESTWCWLAQNNQYKITVSPEKGDLGGGGGGDRHITTPVMDF